MCQIVSSSNIVDSVINEILLSNKIEKIGDELIKHWWNLSKRFSLIKKLYCSIEDEIISSNGIYDPYFCDWSKVFTPIENNLWHEIRSSEMNFFPQYPVGRYFVDFGDPVNKIAIEADGKKWHDAEKDKKRDSEINKLGWRIFRISGKDTYSDDPLEEVRSAYKTRCRSVI